MTLEEFTRTCHEIDAAFAAGHLAAANTIALMIETTPFKDIRLEVVEAKRFIEDGSVMNARTAARLRGYYVEMLDVLQRCQCELRGLRIASIKGDAQRAKRTEASHVESSNGRGPEPRHDRSGDGRERR